MVEKDTGTNVKDALEKGKFQKTNSKGCQRINNDTAFCHTKPNLEIEFHRIND